MQTPLSELDCRSGWNSELVVRWKILVDFNPSPAGQFPARRRLPPPLSEHALRLAQFRLSTRPGALQSCRRCLAAADQSFSLLLAPRARPLVCSSDRTAFLCLPPALAPARQNRLCVLARADLHTPWPTQPSPPAFRSPTRSPPPHSPPFPRNVGRSWREGFPRVHGPHRRAGKSVAA